MVTLCLVHIKCASLSSWDGEGISPWILGEDVPPSSRNSDPISDQKWHFHTVFIPDLLEIMLSLLRFERQLKDFVKLCGIRILLFLFCSFFF